MSMKKRLRDGLPKALLKELNKRQVTIQNQDILVMEEGVTVAANQAEEEIRGDDRTQIMAVVLEVIVVMIRVEEKTVDLVETIIMGVTIIDSVEIIPETVVIIAEVNLKGKKIIVVAMEVIAVSENPTANAEIVMIRSRVRLHHPRRETREVLGVRRHHSRKKKLSNQGWAELVVQLRLKR
jgi:hypothetical protein